MLFGGVKILRRAFRRLDARQIDEKLRGAACELGHFRRTIGGLGEQPADAKRCDAWRQQTAPGNGSQKRASCGHVNVRRWLCGASYSV
jgi:hypothetical protein